jgi:hypothetical protein
MSIQCKYLPYVTLQSNSTDRTAVPSTFTDYDDACLGITTTAPPCRLQSSNNSGWDVRTTEHGLTLGSKLCLVRSRPQPQSKLRLARARSRPPAPKNPVEGHSFNCSLHDCKPQSRLGHGLGKTSVLPERGFSLDSIDKMTPDVTRSYRADVKYSTVCQEIFAILITASTTMTRTTRSPDRLGNTTEPQTPASTLCTVKDANT